MDETIIPEDSAFRINLPTFEGPLDLLLHLIKTHELDILDLPISFVTERYLDYLHMMQELDLDLASEYLLMAATLAHIKSKMLLPQNPLEEAEEQDEGYQEDPRAQLIRRLLEYQKYRQAAEQLGARPIAGRDVFGRGTQAPEAQGPAPLASVDLYKLLDAFEGILKRVKGRVALEVTAEAITIGERISQLSDLLRSRRMCTFTELFEGDRTRYEVVVTFLALLEMTKLRMTRIYQADPSSPLHIQFALLDADEANNPPEDAEEPAASGGGSLVTDDELAAIESADTSAIPAAQIEEAVTQIAQVGLRVDADAEIELLAELSDDEVGELAEADALAEAALTDDELARAEAEVLAEGALTDDELEALDEAAPPPSDDEVRAIAALSDDELAAIAEADALAEAGLSDEEAAALAQAESLPTMALPIAKAVADASASLERDGVAAVPAESAPESDASQAVESEPPDDDTDEAPV